MKPLAVPLVLLLLLTPWVNLPGPAPPLASQDDGIPAEDPPLSGEPVPAPLDAARAREALASYRGEEPVPALWYPALDDPYRERPATLPVPRGAAPPDVHGAASAHALGYTGQGVRVAVTDTGLDFAHPELAGRQARVSDPGSPYFLHPLVYDPTSLNDYLLDGVIDPSRSWFVDTSREATAWTSDDRFFVSRIDGVRNRTWEVTDVKEWAPGETVRLGFHPDRKLEAAYGQRVGLLLYASLPGGAWDRVRADLNHDGDFGDEKDAYLNADPDALDPDAELLYRDATGDGVPDLSGGMVVFIADGERELPYASRQINVSNLVWRTLLDDDAFDIWEERGATPEDHRVPANGSLVVLFGDFGPPGAFGAHGTWVASALAGQGVLDRENQGPDLTGMAPGVELMAAGNLWGGDPLGLPWQSALLFAAEGYDGEVGTGDEAHIVSSSWGSAAFSGWAWGCRLADYLSFVHAENRTLYLFAAGNAGPGHGGLQCPAGGAATLAVGASTDFQYRVDPWFALDGGPSPAFGDVASFSTRGPSALGTQHVDVLANGLFGYGAEPLNHLLVLTGSPDGAGAWLLWAGTSLSTPLAAGAAALIYEAYHAANNRSPTQEEGKLLLMASASDVGNDPFLQGAGLVNATRGVELAGSKRGILPGVSELRPGTYRNESFPGFPRLLQPGEENTTQLVLTNVGPEPLEVEVTTATLTLNTALVHSFTVTSTAPSAEFVLNGTGLHAPDGTRVQELPPGVFEEADALRVSAFTPLRNLAIEGDYLLELMDWTDVDGNGLFGGEPERNRMNFDVVLAGRDHGPNAHQFVHRPAETTTDGLFIWLRALNPGKLGAIQVTLQVDFLARDPFPWVAVTPPSTQILAGNEAFEFEVTTFIPSNASPGVYQTALQVAWEGNVTTIPVTLSVAASGLPFVVEGGLPLATYANDVVYGGATVFDPGSGDARYVFVDLAAAPEDPVSFAVDLPGPNTWAELYVLGPASDWFSDRSPELFGPHGLRVVEVNGMPAQQGITVRANLTDGLHLFAFRGLYVSGEGVGDGFGARALTARLSPPLVVGDGVLTPGSLDLTARANAHLEDVVVLGRGFSETLEFRSERVAAGGVWDYFFVVRDGGYLRAETTGTPGLDLGLALLYRHPILDFILVDFRTSAGTEERIFTTLPRDGAYFVLVVGLEVPPGARFDLTLDVVQGLGVSAEEVSSSLPADTDGPLTVAYELPHVTARWQGVVLVGTSENPDLALAFLDLEPDRPPMFRNHQLPPGAFVNVPPDRVSVEMDDAPDAYYTGIDPDSIRIFLDGVDRTGEATVTQPVGDAFRVELELPGALPDGEYTVRVEASDLNRSWNQTTWSFVVDTVPPTLEVDPLPAYTNIPVLLVEGRVEVGASLFVQGQRRTYGDTGAFAVELALEEGTHEVVVRAVDRAGNEAVHQAVVVVDRTPPLLVVEEPRDGSEALQATVRVRGTSEPGVSLTLDDWPVDVDAEGRFDASVELEEGTHRLRLVATDPAGNTATVEVEVTYAGLDVRLQVALLLGLGVLALLAAAAALLLYLRILRRREGP